jgi:colanic acid biosynthesis glycosyl transferase WcaI
VETREPTRTWNSYHARLVHRSRQWSATVRRSTDRRRITIVSPYYAPEHSGTAPYVTALAEHLATANDVTVITGVPHYPDWKVRHGYRQWRTEQEDEHLRLIRLLHYVPPRQTALRRGAYELSFAGRALATGMRASSDVVVAFCPPVLSTTAARGLAVRHGAAFGIVVHDLAGQGARESGIAGGARVARAVGLVEGNTLRSADGVVVLHDRFRRPLTQQLGVEGGRITVIRNWVHVPEATEQTRESRSRLGWGDEFVVLHTGNMGLKQGLENVVYAARLADARGERIRFVLMGDGSQRISLERIAQGVQAISFVDPLPGDAYVAALRAADVLLVNERPGMAEMSLPSKLTSYFCAGRPVLAATDSDSPTAREMADSGAGPIVPSGDPLALLLAALKLGRDSSAAAAHGNAARQFAEEHFVASKALSCYDAWIDQLMAVHRGCQPLRGDEARPGNQGD